MRRDPPPAVWMDWTREASGSLLFFSLLLLFSCKPLPSRRCPQYLAWGDNSITLPIMRAHRAPPPFLFLFSFFHSGSDPDMHMEARLSRSAWYYEETVQIGIRSPAASEPLFLFLSFSFFPQLRR